MDWSHNALTTNCQVVMLRAMSSAVSSPLLSGGDGAYPWFGSVFGGSGMAVGAGVLKRLEHAAYINLQAGISINASTMMRGEFASPQLWRGRLQLDASGQWLEAKDVAFYGFGQDSSKLTRESIDYSPKDVGGNVTVRPMRFVSLVGLASPTSVFTSDTAAPL